MVDYQTSKYLYNLNIFFYANDYHDIIYYFNILINNINNSKKKNS